MSVSGGRPGAADEPRVADIMTGRPITVHPEATVKQLADLLRAHHISGVPVVDGERHVVGVVTDGDLVAEDADLRFPHYIQFLDSLIYLDSTKKFEERLKKAVGARVADIMTADVISVHREDEMRVAATLMSEHKINLVPVVDDDNKLVGVVTRHDVVAGLGL
jgi:CBS domain-containing protein